MHDRNNWTSNTQPKGGSSPASVSQTHSAGREDVEGSCGSCPAVPGTVALWLGPPRPRPQLPPSPSSWLTSAFFAFLSLPTHWKQYHIDRTSLLHLVRRAQVSAEESALPFSAPCELLLRYEVIYPLLVAPNAKLLLSRRRIRPKRPILLCFSLPPLD